MLKNVPGASLATVAERAAQLRVPFYRPRAAVAKITTAEITLAARPGCLYLSVGDPLFKQNQPFIEHEALAELWPKIAANGGRGDACWRRSRATCVNCSTPCRSCPRYMPRRARSSPMDSSFF